MAKARAEREDALVLQAHRLAGPGLEDVLAADRACRAVLADMSRGGVEGLPRYGLGAFERTLAEVARRQGTEAVHHEHVRDRAELAVLGRPRAQRARGKILGEGQHRSRVGDRTRPRAAHGNALEALGSEDGAEPAAAGVAAVPGDRRVAHEVLACGANAEETEGTPEPLGHACFRVERREAHEVVGRLDAHVAVFDHEQGPRGRGTGDHERVHPGVLELDGEAVAGERVSDAVRERGLGDDRELGARGQGRADERREGHHHRGLRRQGVHARRARVHEEPGSEAAAAEEGTQDGLLDRSALCGARAQIDVE